MRALVAVLAISFSLHADPFAGGVWTSRGPTNISGLTTAFLVDPDDENVYLAATSGGVWTSNDAGASWSPIAQLDGVPIWALARHPVRHDEIWAGGPGIGLLKSIDRGRTWDTLPESQYWAVQAIDISLDSKVFVAAIDGLHMNRSGSTWQTFRNDGLFNPRVRFHPTDPMRAVAVLGRKDANSEVRPTPFVTADGGLTWQQASGIDTSTLYGLVVEYAPSQPSTLIAYGSPYPYRDPGMIWRSTDDGQTFQSVGTSANIGDGQRVIALAISPANANQLVTGGVYTYRSVNGGTTSTEITELQGSRYIPHPDVHGLKLVDAKRAFVWGDGGVYRTDDVFASPPKWKHLAASLVNAQVYHFDVGARGNVVLGMQDTGMNVMPPQSTTATYLYDGDTARVLFDPLDEPVFYSEWVPGLIYRSTQVSFPFVDVRGGQRKFGSAFTIDAYDWQRMYAGAGIVARIDGIQSAQPTVTTIRTNDATTATTAIAVQPYEPNVVWMAIDRGEVYRTKNALAASPTWEQVYKVPPAQGNPVKIVFDANDTRRVWVLARYGLQVTRDGGKTWSIVRAATPYELTDFAVHPTRGDWVYLSSRSGLAGSVDSGMTWTKAALPHPNVTAILFSAGGRTLWASTYGRGLWSIDIDAPAPHPKRRAARR